jgi:hypothetical protein
VKAGFDQVRDSSDMIDMDVREQQSGDAIEGEIDFRGWTTPSIGSLKRTAIDEDRFRGVQVELVARSGDT